MPEVRIVAEPRTEFGKGAARRTRRADKVMYAGYYPMGLSLRRIFDELPSVALRDEVWPRFLRDNAVRVFKLGGNA